MRRLRYSPASVANRRIHSPSFTEMLQLRQLHCAPALTANLANSTTDEQDVIRVHGPMGWCRE